MTEKRGGSDVNGGTETIATPINGEDGYYSLTGYKWFSSATDSDMVKFITILFFLQKIIVKSVIPSICRLLL